MKENENVKQKRPKLSKEKKFYLFTAIGCAAALLAIIIVAVIITNAKFSKTQLCKIAGMAQDGYARSIRPVHTSADGDSIYAVSVGNVAADQDVIGILAAEVVSEAILRAVEKAESAYGYPSAAELRKK